MVVLSVGFLTAFDNPMVKVLGVFWHVPVHLERNALAGKVSSKQQNKMNALRNVMVKSMRRKAARTFAMMSSSFVSKFHDSGQV